MHLPTPTHTFTIPSLHDGLRLDCRIYHPQGQLNPGSPSCQRIRGAIVAHPYAPLGGCYDDPVVGFVAGELLRAGFVVGTFNFRGAGGSDGRTSWTGRPELADYASFYEFMLLYLHRLRDTRSTSSQYGEDNLEAVQLILGGYSYGSMIASSLPHLDLIADVVRQSNHGTPMHEIYQIARDLVYCSEEDKDILEQEKNTPQEMRRVAGTIQRTTVAYLLISPILPPINRFLTLFAKLSLDIGTFESSQRQSIPCPQPADQVCAHETLALYGTQDTFTSVHKLQTWSKELRQNPSSKFRSVEIDGAGHFWIEDGVRSQARDAIRNWLFRIH
ncbi:alpha/beta-hydrolase [Aspergillus indologenus CBS 114.80]|uniref:Alpha/beta-hydrolase n=1 Tax=Aspergillus indologenus CBS 114.80 TaxID=1450541 RepID=A0A2V5IF74_9EURO|nr:alpha/beta-hydrolase [Aspergillus indologenus CBS 114.80]